MIYLNHYRQKRHLRKVALLFCGILPLTTWFIWQGWNRPPATTTAFITLESGTPLKALARQLEDRQVITNPTFFTWYVRLFADYRQFQAGRYEIPLKSSWAMIVEKLQTGKVVPKLIAEVVIPEGFDLKRISSRFAAQGIGTIAEYKQLATNQEFLFELGVDAKSIEGYLYPATYQFWDQRPTPRQVLHRMHREFKRRLPRGYKQQLQEHRLNFHQWVTFASLIEREAKDDEERRRIAEVIWNRLKKRMRLGIDASLIYGIVNYQGDIKTKHLRDRSNPYNSRIHYGLPPGPIASPSEDSLLAVFEPTDDGWMYFVVDPETKRHQFSRTFAAHQQAVRKLVKHTRHRR